MSNLKQKLGYKVIALCMAVLMLLSMIPAAVIAYALDSTESNPYKAQNFTAVYNAKNDSVDLSWDAFETEPYELWFCVDGTKTEQLSVTDTTYSFDTTVGGEKEFSLLTFVDAEDTEGVKSDEIAVQIAETFAAVVEFDAAEVENNLTISQIVALLPTEAVVTDSNGTSSAGHTVQWNAEGANYDQTVIDAGSVFVPGVVVLDTTKVQNRDGLSLVCSIEVKVKAAEDISITTDLNSATINKKVGEGLSLSIEAKGTAPAYQWYKKTENSEGVAINGASAATLNLSSLALGDEAQYYCVVTGKNNSTATSKPATVKVAKNDVNLQLSISPAAGQTRPNPIEIEVLNVPADATGTIHVKESGNVIHSATLGGYNNGNVKFTFTATGASNNFVFSVEYTGDSVKYNECTVAAVPYDFNKGIITITSVNGIPGDVKALDEFVITPVATLDPTSNTTAKYSYSVSDPTVAKIDANGKVTTLRKGEFKITVTALGNDDYNGCVFETDVISVDYANRSGLTFEASHVTEAYYSGFSYQGVNYTDKSVGKGDLVFSIANAPSDYIVIDADGKVSYSDEMNPSDKDLNAPVGDVVVKLTKQTDGIYEEISATYTLTITKGQQAALNFEKPSMTITYTADADGTHTATAQNVATGGSVKADVVYSTEDVFFIKLDAATGAFTAIKPGTATVKATIAGNDLFEEVSATYEITIEKGSIEGFDFNETDTDKLTTTFGVPFANMAGNKHPGQSTSTGGVKYEIIDVSDALAGRVGVDNLGVVYFDNIYAKAPDAAEYFVTVRATKAENELFNAKSIEYRLTIKRDAVSIEDFKINGKTIKDADSSDGWYNAEHDNIIITPANGYTSISTDGENFHSEIVIENDYYNDKLTFYLKKENGAVSRISAQQTVQYDKTKATIAPKMGTEESFWSKLLETITFGLWHNNNVTLTVTANDNLSGIASISYYEAINPSVIHSTASAIEGAALAWVDCQIDETEKGALELTKKIDVSISDNENKKSVVYVRVVDCAGNVDYYVSSGMIFDKADPDQTTEIITEPIIKIQLDEYNEQNLYNGAVDFKLTVNDKQTNAVASGIKTIVVTIQGSIHETYKKIITVDANHSEIASFDSSNVDDREFTVDGDFTIPADFNSNHLTIYVEVTDYAGNTYNNSDNLTHLAIDSIKPVIDVTYNDKSDANPDGVTVSNEKYFGNNQGRVATITITELNFKNDGVCIKVTQDGDPRTILPQFNAIAKNANDEDVVWTMDVDFGALGNGEGDFTFNVSCTDEAQNTNDGWNGDTLEVNKNFTLDNTKPAISVEITNDEVKNDKFFAADRTATVTIIERNFLEAYLFNWEGLTLTLDGVKLAAPTPVIVKNDKNTYERVYTIDFSAEGDYTFNVTYTDLADNVSDGYICKSVAHSEFTIDKTAPELEITGVANHSANNGTVAPVITYSDVNFDAEAVSIILSGVNNGRVNYDGSYADAVHGQTFTYANFEEVQKVDDIYTLTAKLTDLAGNETQKTISFSANRFGSVYDLTAISDIISKYLKNEKDIVFTETNADTLDRDHIKLKLTKNGTPSDLVEGTDYTVEVSGGNGKWSVYKYIVKKSLFADDGRYSISVYSTDRAGNVNENIDETKDAEISFGIDKTNPVIVPVDFESGKQYAVDSKTVSVEIKDNLVLEGVKIYLNDKEVSYTVDGEIYTFEIGKSASKQNVKIVAVDAAGNEEPIDINGFLVNANIFVRWVNNTPLFIGSIVGVVALALAAVAFFLFGKKKKNNAL